jgi:hypothetical protein
MMIPLFLLSSIHPLLLSFAVTDFFPGPSMLIRGKIKKSSLAG